MPYRLRLCLLATIAALGSSALRGQGGDEVAVEGEALTGPIAGVVGEMTIGREAWSEAEEAEVVARLEALTSIIDVTAHPITQGYIKGYTIRKRAKAEAALGRIPAYFPTFERALAAAGLPDDLKYLAFTESALDPRARSRVGAGGLWQFMPGTARMYGLRIDDYLDERADPEKATQAAMRFLADEYARFGDWSLVLAAYNGGPARVRRAVRRSGKRDYWELRRYLPRETRNYVPAFVAAKYLHYHGSGHGLTPGGLTLDEQFATPVPYAGGMPLHEVAQACDLSLDLLRAMNPHLLRDSVVAREGVNVRVPARVARSLTSYLEWRDGGGSRDAAELVELVRARVVRDSGDLAGNDFHYVRQLRTVPAGVSFTEFAEPLGLSEHHLALWNPLAPATSPVERRVVVYLPRFVPETPFSEIPDVVIPRVGARAAAPLDIREPIIPSSLDARLPNQRYRLQRYESLLEVWQRYSESMTWREFVAWNRIVPGSAPPAGTQLLVRED